MILQNILCFKDCAYQKDGFCLLEYPISNPDCIYRNYLLNQWMLQMPHEYLLHQLPEFPDYLQ